MCLFQLWSPQGLPPTSDSARHTAFSQGEYPLVFAHGFGRGWSVPLTQSWQNSPQTSDWFLYQSVLGFLRKILGKKLFTGTSTRVRHTHPGLWRGLPPGLCHQSPHRGHGGATGDGDQPCLQSQTQPGRRDSLSLSLFFFNCATTFPFRKEWV